MDKQGPRSRLVSYEVTLPDLVINEASAKMLIDQAQPTSMHNGGGMLFGQDGYLYLGLGDGGPENDESRNSQNIKDGFFSGIIRIDVYGENRSEVKPISRQPKDGSTKGYWIPNSNPFVGQEGVLEEFWALGLRNPFRMATIPGTPQIIVSDVGQSTYEEINILSAGDNAQWSYREGPLPYRLTWHKGKRPSDLKGKEAMPWLWYPNTLDRGCVIGGPIYTGSLFPELRGKYLFGDWRSGELFSVSMGGETSGPVERILSKTSKLDLMPQLISSIYQYGEGLLITRLGPGSGGQSILSLKPAAAITSVAGSSFADLPAREKYKLLCSRCHGTDGVPPNMGEVPGVLVAKNFTDKSWQSEVTDGKIWQTIQEGVVGPEGGVVMPSWKEVLTDSDRQAFIELIRGFGN